MAAAPALGFYCSSSVRDLPDTKRLTYFCALRSFQAQITHPIKVAKERKCFVNLKLAAVELGAFGNHVEMVQQALLESLSLYVDEMKEHGVRAQFQIHGTEKGEKDEKAFPIAQKMGLEIKDRASSTIWFADTSKIEATANA